jgi:acyl carrier protein
MTDEKDIIPQIMKLLEPFNTQGASITPQTDISSDLNIDSVAVMDFVMEVEDHFDIEIPLNEVAETRTVAELAAVVSKRRKKG